MAYILYSTLRALCMMNTIPTGRFAPTPSGPLHFGSLLTAVASYLDIKSQGGRWLLRIDDLDPRRSSQESARDILEVLHRHGLSSDAPCVWQSERAPLYADALASLRETKQAFECTCTRKKLKGQRVYPGTCRYSAMPVRSNQSTRFIAPAIKVTVRDAVQGDIQEHLADDCGDFVIFRRDGVAAYHLATVVDDADMGVTRVLRGADLFASTPRQVALARALGLPVPCFAHIPVVLDARKRKASKSLAATPLQALSDVEVKRNLAWCMQLLGLSTPRLASHSPESLLDWASNRFCLGQVPAVTLRSDFLCV